MHYLARRTYGSLALSAAALAGCSSASKQMGPAAATGNLTVTITAADGTKPSVVITGPSSYNNTISATQTLTGLPVGQYTIVANAATVPDSVVGTIVDTGTVTGSPATVSSNGTATATVTYALEHRLGGLWIGNQRYSTIGQLAASQLRGSGSVTPAETLATTVSGPAGLALDASGNMWVSSIENARGDSLVMYTPAARNAGGGTAPSRVLISTAISNPQTITFDHHGNLWLANCSGQQLLEFSSSQLVAGGNQTPAVTIGTMGFVQCPYALAFDTTGNVWVADGAGTHLLEYGVHQLTTSASPTPIDTIGTQGLTLEAPNGLAFDSHGNLWVSNDGSPTVISYTPAQLALGGAPTPNVTVTMPMGIEPHGIAFDNRGGLWVSDADGGIVHGLTSSQIAATGAPTPAVTDTLILSGGVSPQQLLFDPYAVTTGVSAARAHAAPPAVASVHRSNASATQLRSQQ